MFEKTGFAGEKAFDRPRSEIAAELGSAAAVML
jgi:hypothetical protein